MWALIEPMSRSAPRRAQVVNLAEARARSRHELYQERLNQVLADNKRAVGRLYASGSMFTKEGTRAGRDLLLAHQHLLKVVGLLDRLAHQGDVPAPLTPAGMDEVYAELDTLFSRTDELRQKTQELLKKLTRH
jgi:hypothetical protein